MSIITHGFKKKKKSIVLVLKSAKQGLLIAIAQSCSDKAEEGPVLWILKCRADEYYFKRCHFKKKIRGLRKASPTMNGSNLVA